MSEPTPQRPPMPDDLDRAYAQAHAMSDAGRGPSAAVRANVLAAAQEIATQGAAAAKLALTPVAPPVTAVGRGRLAVNLSSWRVRAGAAFCAALLVGVAGWRLDASRRFDAGTQLASAALEMKVVPPEPAQARVSKDLPRDSAMPVPQVPLPSAPVEVVRTQAAPNPEPAAKPAAPEKNTVVAQADPPLRARALAPAPVVAATAARVAVEEAKKSAPAPAQSLQEASERPLPAPLQAAVDRGDVEALKQLLANPATPVDAPDATGRTALLHAVLGQQVAAVRLLMAAGADPGRADQAGLTPRAAALTGANAEIATLLSTPR
jgi:hypothetical protein